MLQLRWQKSKILIQRIDKIRQLIWGLTKKPVLGAFQTDIAQIESATMIYKNVNIKPYWDSEAWLSI